MLGANNVIDRPERDVTRLYSVPISAAEMRAAVERFGAEESCVPLAAKFREYLARIEGEKP